MGSWPAGWTLPSALVPGKQRAASRLPRRQPVELPAPPRVPPSRVKELGLGPGPPAVRAHSDPCDLSLSGPRRAADRVHLVRDQRLVNARASDLGLQFHLSQRRAAPVCRPVRPSSRSRSSASSPGTVRARPGCAAATSPTPCRNDRVRQRARGTRDPAKGRGRSSGARSAPPAAALRPGTNSGRTRSALEGPVARPGLPCRPPQARPRRRQLPGRALEQVRQGHAGPLGVAHGAELPLRPCHLRDEKDPAVPAHSRVATRVSDGSSRNCW